MKNFKTLSALAIFATTVFLVSGCSVSQDRNIEPLNVNIEEYGPKTFNANYVDETKKINSLDAPVAETLDEVKSDQYVLVTLDNAILSGQDYQMLYSGDSQSVVLMKKEDAVSLASNNSDVVLEPNKEYQLSDEAQATQSGGSLSQWGLDRIDQTSLPLDDSYTYNNTGLGVTSYVVDSGIRTTHTDFTGRIPKGFDTIGDGYGYTDCMGHGTHVAGTVGGTNYGVAKQTTIIPVRVFGCTGSATGTNLMNGFNWIKANHSGGPAVVNLSLGGVGVDAGWRTVVDDMVANGFIMVVAAGNDTIDACGVSPAYVPNAITVGATTDLDAISSFSNYGSCVDIMAPGTSIASASYLSDSGVLTYNGTSMAAPHVAGAVARILQKEPSYNAIQVSEVLASMSNQNKLTSLPAGTPNRLLYVNPAFSTNVLVASSDVIPKSPRILAVKTIKVNNLPEVHVYGENVAGNVTGYNVNVALAGQSSTIYTATASSPDTSKMIDITINGLTNNTAYDVWVTATNSVGTSTGFNKTRFTVVMP